MCFRPAYVDGDKTCPNCGNSCDFGEAVCPNCGTPLPDIAIPDEVIKQASGGAPKPPAKPMAPPAPKKK